jgi:biotin carboxyl carrier protein
MGIDGKFLAADIAPSGASSFHVLAGNRGYQMRLVSYNIETREFVVRVNGNLYHLQVKTPMDELLQKMGIDATASKKIDRITAPMPGLVLQVSVAPGDLVKKGDNVLVLEAMKMENAIKSPADGKVKTVLATPGKAVEKNAPLILFE